MVSRGLPIINNVTVEEKPKFFIILILNIIYPIEKIIYSYHNTCSKPYLIWIQDCKLITIKLRIYLSPA